jgi:hypothetical protein
VRSAPRFERLGVRWTIGNVAPRGFEALRLSLWGARRLFGPAARYCVCVNSLPVDEARALTGRVPEEVEWREVDALPAMLAPHLEPGLAEGVAWKLAPLRCWPDRYELSLDNDVVLWDLPPAIGAWLDGDDGRCLLAEDVRPAFGRFAALCGERALNSGIRGLPPGFALERALAAVLARSPVTLTSELDEQGLQVAALLPTRPHIVPTSDVSICSPFPPHQPGLGRAGAHFVGLNARRLQFRLFCDRSSELVRAEHRDALAPTLRARVGAPEGVDDRP